MRAIATVFVAVVSAGACRTPLDELDGAFYAWDGRRVHCTIEIDDRAGFSLDDISAGLDRVQQTGEVLELLVHVPGESIMWPNLEAVLAAVKQRDLPFLTTTDMLRGEPRGGVALMYDDWYSAPWTESVPLLDEYGARVTVFVARYAGFEPARKAELQAMADKGHDIEAHSTYHRRGPSFVDEYGVRAYLDEEVLPSIDQLRADGYEVLSYAYPFGARTSETDEAILDTRQVEMVRSLSRANELRANPCPN
jgi:peptidoglycan/xylan/chitin deacetylase (PgdA/CDA1 family)